MPQTTTPVPATGLPAGVETGPLGQRLAAQLIDVVVPLLIGTVATLIIAQVGPETSAATAISVVGWLLVAAWVVLVCHMYATRAAGPGMLALKLQLVGLRNGRPIGWGRFVVRSLILAGLTVTVVGLVAMLVLLVRHPRKQGWHDLVAESVVIKQRPLAPTRTSAAQAQTSPALSNRVPQPSSPGATVNREGEGAPVRLTPPDGAAAPSPVGSAASVDRRPPEQGRVAAGGVGAHVLSTDGTEASVRSRPQQPANRQPTSSAAATGGAAPATRQDHRPLDQGWVAILDDERAVEITGLVLLGRNPQARPGEDEAELIKVADETRTVSKTHLSLSVDANGLFVMDRGSTNGTTLTSVVGVSQPCPPGDVMSASEGSIVSFGDHWLKIERRFDR